MRRGRPIAGLLLATAVVAAAALATTGDGAPRSAPHRGALRIERAVLHGHAIALRVSNGTERTERLAQVAIDRGFVPFAGAGRALAPHATEQLEIPYPWVRGESYDVEVLTGSGATLSFRVSAPS